MFFAGVLSAELEKGKKFSSITRVSLANNRSVHFRRVDHALDYANFSIRRGTRTRHHPQKRWEL